MSRKTLALFLALGLTLVNLSVATDLITGAGLHLRCAQNCGSCETPVNTRPDEYCGKSLPCASRLGCNHSDNYSQKCLPCLPCPSQSDRCNDYRKKTMPTLCPIHWLRPNN